MKKKILIISGVVLGIILIAVIGIAIRYNKMVKTVGAFKIETVDLTAVQDGTYQGKAGDFLVDVTLNVTVKEGKIEKIELVIKICG